ncbi:MAG: hypothetical protein R6V19_11665, partial [Armatimonadota bacterium]
MSSDKSHSAEWVDDVWFGLHYDLHARDSDTELGAELTAEHLKERLERVKPDWVQCDCKGHPGYTSYPTTIGSPSPGIVRDALQIHRQVADELGIPLSVHYSGVLDTRAIELHPEWAARDPEGEIIGRAEGRSDVTCRLSAYVDELVIPQMLDVIDRYDVDGFWVDGDCWAVRNCYCDRCREVFEERTGITEPPTDPEDPNWDLWREFQRDMFVEYVRKYTDAVHERKPECAVCSNWMYSARHPGEVTVDVDYLSGDLSPSWGAERGVMEGRCLDSRGLPWNLMAWSFCRPGLDVPYQTKTAAQLCQEAGEIMSCGGAVMLYDQPQRTGWLTGWHQDLFAEVAEFCRARKPFCEHSTSVPDAVVLHSEEHVFTHVEAPFNPLGNDTLMPMQGAVHALLENHFHVDINDEQTLRKHIDDYGLVVVPEQDPISDAMPGALEEYARGGGIVLMTGLHLAARHGDLVGVKPAGDVTEGRWHLPVDDEAATVSEQWQPVQTTDAEVYCSIMDQQEVGKDETSWPAVTVRTVGEGAVIAIHGPVMSSFFKTHHPRLRRFLEKLLDDMNVPRRVRIEGPPNLECTLREKDGMLAVSLVNRAADP